MFSGHPFYLIRIIKIIRHNSEGFFPRCGIFRHLSRGQIHKVKKRCKKLIRSNSKGNFPSYRFLFLTLVGSCSYVVPRFMSDSKNQTLKDTTQEMTRLWFIASVFVETAICHKRALKLVTEEIYITSGFHEIALLGLDISISCSERVLLNCFI